MPPRHSVSSQAVMLAVGHILAISRYESRPTIVPTRPDGARPFRGSGSFWLRMTHPIAQTVRAEGAAAIRAAIVNGDKLVTVGAEPWPGADELVQTSYIVAHIVALVEMPKPQREIVDEAGPKVTALWERRQRP